MFVSCFIFSILILSIFIFFLFLCVYLFIYFVSIFFFKRILVFLICFIVKIIKKNFLFLFDQMQV
jgi:hypothetical protein